MITPSRERIKEATRNWVVKKETYDLEYDSIDDDYKFTESDDEIYSDSIDVDQDPVIKHNEDDRGRGRRSKVPNKNGINLALLPDRMLSAFSFPRTLRTASARTVLWL